MVDIFVHIHANEHLFTFMPPGVNLQDNVQNELLPWVWVLDAIELK